MMIDTKTAETLPREPAPLQQPPPAYAASRSSLGPQWQQMPQPSQQSGSPDSTQPPQPPQPAARTLTDAELGEQYRAAQFAQCAQGNHVRTVKYGVCGIITAVILFPVGLLCLFADKEEICARCGNKL
ncbi:putative uncharacterized conserved protein (DUF2367) [Lyophyllum shimeji]|uniref:Uncharacterized conserved protein (DUF2367) n=1 Tax=Lyophyllum shimeji TaxID=47721 RepID=A0A9P3PT99_LYOSH|nr:putative uncharacterized conserved protein (DUF2367) [Lyophyllum shimeji]